MARLATSNTEEALDLVQDAMFKLAEKYGDRSESEWPPLFTKILQSKIKDWYRKTSVRSRYRVDLSVSEEHEDPIQTAKDTQSLTPDKQVQTDDSMSKLQEALEELPLRQQQAFLLRAWEGLDVKQTAAAMSCAEGSVKTHYSRAVHTLRDQLGEHWP